MRIGEKRCNCSCFEINQEMDAILLIISIVYGVCRIVIKSIQQCPFNRHTNYELEKKSHDIAEILLNLMLNTIQSINQSINQSIILSIFG
jgi:hypothetical protein